MNSTETIYEQQREKDVIPSRLLYMRRRFRGMRRNAIWTRVPGYIPYADQNGLWNRAWSGPDRALIEQDWKAHMSGSTGLTQSLDKLIEDLAAAQQH